MSSNPLVRSSWVLISLVPAGVGVAMPWPVVPVPVPSALPPLLAPVPPVVPVLPLLPVLAPPVPVPPSLPLCPILETVLWPPHQGYLMGEAGAGAVLQEGWSALVAFW